ncbi:hypothetical protein [Bradyrhizobium sp. NBAIM01]|uniref:hypothetical protein n=1 Tax=Bradyrhizobium sp. NBAIM01 TaxID=2793818 RepID=UPI003209DD9B
MSIEQRLAFLLAHGTPLVVAAAVHGALDLEQRIEASDRLQCDWGDRFALRASLAFFSMSASSKKPRRAWAKQNAGVIGSRFLLRIGNGSNPLAIRLQDTGEASGDVRLVGRSRRNRPVAGGADPP